MDGWTVIPRWLYENDLPDLELQEVYVRQAEKTWRECVEVRRDAEAAYVEARLVEARAKQFLTDAQEVLKKYQRQRPPPAPAPSRSPRRLDRPRRALPKPRGDG